MNTQKKNVTKSFSLPIETAERIDAQAKRESTSFASIVRRAITRDLTKAAAAQTVQEEIIPITEAARICNLSVSRMLARARKKGDPIYAARVRIGKLKPLHFRLSGLMEVRKG